MAASLDIYLVPPDFVPPCFVPLSFWHASSLVILCRLPAESLQLRDNVFQGIHYPCFYTSGNEMYLPRHVRLAVPSGAERKIVFLSSSGSGDHG